MLSTPSFLSSDPRLHHSPKLPSDGSTAHSPNSQDRDGRRGAKKQARQATIKKEPGDRRAGQKEGRGCSLVGLQDGSGQFVVCRWEGWSVYFSGGAEGQGQCGRDAGG